MTFIINTLRKYYTHNHKNGQKDSELKGFQKCCQLETSHNYKRSTE